MPTSANGSCSRRPSPTERRGSGGSGRPAASPTTRADRDPMLDQSATDRIRTRTDLQADLHQRQPAAVEVGYFVEARGIGHGGSGPSAASDAPRPSDGGCRSVRPGQRASHRRGTSLPTRRLARPEAGFEPSQVNAPSAPWSPPRRGETSVGLACRTRATCAKIGFPACEFEPVRAPFAELGHRLEKLDTW